jgi:hypothetical protein
MAAIPDEDEDEDEEEDKEEDEGEDVHGIPHVGSTDSGNSGNFSVIVGKSFEAMTLPDGSQQIVETTRYKRLRDGYVYSESKMRSLDDDRVLGDGGTTNDAKQVGVVEDDDFKVRAEMMADARLIQESSKMLRIQPRPPLTTAKDTSPFGSPVKGGKYPFDQPDMHPTFSTSSGEFSSTASDDGRASDGFQTSVVTEDHAFGRNDGGNGILVEEFLYDSDPVGLRQWKEQTRPPSPSDQRRVDVDAAADEGGWCAFGDSSTFNGNDTPNSLQLGRPRNWWPLISSAAFPMPSSGKVKSIFHADDDRNDGGGSVSGLPMGYPRDEKDSDDGDYDDEAPTRTGRKKGRSFCNAQKRTRSCKLTALAISLVVTIGAIIVAVMLVVPPRSREVVAPMENLDEVPVVQSPPPSPTPVQSPPPSPTPCVNLEISLSVSNPTSDVNAWSLSRIGEDGEEVTINSSEVLPEKSGDSHVYKSCVESGVYTFSISDTSGDGLGIDGEGGYYITADGVILGISSFFFDNEKMTFELPLDPEDANTGDDHKSTVCTDDFLLALHTDSNPGETTWNVIDNVTGKEVLAGGAYPLPLSLYTHRACLPDGSYTFNMLDDGGDGVCCNNGKGFFLLSKDGKTIVNSNGDFGAESSVVFVLGDEDI